MTQWREFEILAAEIFRQLEPNASVTHNGRIVCKSGVSRQIDVPVRSQIAGHKFLMVVGTKDYRRPANIAEVDKFAGKVADVGANKGILVCSAGFSSGVHSAAKGKGIDLSNLHDAETPN